MGNPLGVCSYVVDWLTSTLDKCTRLTDAEQSKQDTHASSMSEKDEEDVAIPHGQTTPSMCKSMRKTRKRRVLPTRKEIARYRHQRALIKAERHHLYRAHPLVIKGSVMLDDPDLDIAKDLEKAFSLTSELHDVGDLGRMRQGHVAGDGNCLWRALTKARHAAGHAKISWQNMKKRCLHAQDGDVHVNHIRVLRVYGCWGDNAAICLAATRLNCKIRVNTGAQVVTYTPGNAKDKLAICFHKHHFSLLYPVDDNGTNNFQGMMSDKSVLIEPHLRTAMQQTDVRLETSSTASTSWWATLTRCVQSTLSTVLQGGMQRDEDLEFDTPEEARRHRTLQIERYYIWLSDLQEEYEKTLLRIGDQLEDWTYTADAADIRSPTRTLAVNRLIDITQTVRAEADAVRRLSELTAVIPHTVGGL